MTEPNETECVALVVRDSTLIVEALTRLRATLPFRVIGVDTDSGREFLNDPVLAYCAAQQIAFTRSLPYRKNDQAWVEQKNGAVVRRLVERQRASYGRVALHSSVRPLAV